MPVFNYPDYHINSIRNAVCSNPIAEVIDSCDAINATPSFPRIRNNSAYAMDIDIVRNTLEGMAQNANAAFGDLAVMRDIQSRAAMSHADVLRKLEDDYRKWEVVRINKLIRSKATIRYSIEVK